MPCRVGGNLRRDTRRSPDGLVPDQKSPPSLRQSSQNKTPPRNTKNKSILIIDRHDLSRCHHDCRLPVARRARSTDRQTMLPRLEHHIYIYIRQCLDVLQQHKCIILLCHAIQSCFVLRPMPSVRWNAQRPPFFTTPKIPRKKINKYIYTKYRAMYVCFVLFLQNICFLSVSHIAHY